VIFFLLQKIISNVFTFEDSSNSKR